MSYPIPTGIPTSVTLPELALLQEFAARAGTVLEIGTHYGFTCIGMALAGAHVTSVDPHFEGPADNPDTWEPFLANAVRHGLRMDGPHQYSAFLWNGDAHVVAFKEPVEEMDFNDADPPFGLVFIDGNHVWPCPWRDIGIAQTLLTPDGFIAMHDVTPNWPGVYRAALQLVAKGWKEVGRAGCLRVYRSGATAGACKVCGASAGAECDHADHVVAAEVGFRL